MKFDEFSLGQIFETGSYEITTENIMAFAREYDPLYLHLDEEQARQSRFGQIIASGLQTLCVCYKLWVELGLFGRDVVAGMGFNNVKFIKPVYPGDRLRTVVEVIDKKPVREDVGKVTILLSALNDKNETVLSGELSVLIQR